MDAANVDLKAFTERFYRKVCGGTLEAVLDTLVYLRHETDVWFEITTLLIPGENDSDREIDAAVALVRRAPRARRAAPLHGVPSRLEDDGPPADAARDPDAARAAIALGNGLRYVYTGNVHDAAGGTTYCHGCGEALIERDWYEILGYRLTADGRCRSCGARCPGLFEGEPGAWGAKRRPVRLRPEPSIDRSGRHLVGPASLTIS